MRHLLIVSWNSEISSDCQWWWFWSSFKHVFCKTLSYCYILHKASSEKTYTMYLEAEVNSLWFHLCPLAFLKSSCFFFFISFSITKPLHTVSNKSSHATRKAWKASWITWWAPHPCLHWVLIVIYWMLVMENRAAWNLSMSLIALWNIKSGGFIRMLFN